ncbi:hypothetical protein PPUN12996_30410 [Pseudomonas putida]|nr:hypothetical protein PPUN12996_30410 [Pseudomonas putida]
MDFHGAWLCRPRGRGHGEQGEEQKLASHVRFLGDRRVHIVQTNRRAPALPVCAGRVNFPIARSFTQSGADMAHIPISPPMRPWPEVTGHE